MADDRNERRIIEILNERITPFLADIIKQQEVILAVLDDLKAAVARNRSVQDSAVMLLSGLKTKLDSATVALSEGGVDTAELETLSADLGAQTDALAAAVAKNTVADTTAPNPEPPAPVDVPVDTPTEPQP